ncbi:MAG TPA: DUF5715 family protein [Acidobacteriaceae bacterium]|nr:DUF5715 family protein [Acidobacteriaceae bacterium]
MLNPASRFEENAEAHSSLLRPLAIFFVIALALAASSSQPVQAASREHSAQHGNSAPAHILTHSYSVSHRRAVASTARARRTRHEAAKHAASSRARRRSAVAQRNSRRRHGSRSVVVRDVEMTRSEPMARPVAGANSLVVAASGSATTGTSHPAEAAMPKTEVEANVAAPGLSANDMAQAAIQPHVTPMYTRTGRLIVPPPLRGSREILVHQNQMADAAGLERIDNDEELNRLRYQHQLVEVAGTSALHVNPELPENRRYARPWTAKFASDIARAYYARFREPLELNSAVRTISYQLRLQRVNGNAADIAGETASPHLTGQAIDFGKKGMTRAQIAWMRMYLTPLMQAGMIDVEEEFQQACFHISVYRGYVRTRPPDVAEEHRVVGSTASSDDLER